MEVGIEELLGVCKVELRELLWNLVEFNAGDWTVTISPVFWQNLLNLLHP